MLRVVGFCLMLVFLSGCGRSYTDNSNDPEAYARDIKEVALNAVNAARKGRESADSLRTLVRELQNQEKISRPVGSYKATYDELLGLALPLMEDCEKARGRVANLNPRLDALKKLADGLPGVVQLNKN